MVLTGDNADFSHQLATAVMYDDCCLRYISIGDVVCSGPIGIRYDPPFIWVQIYNIFLCQYSLLFVVNENVDFSHFVNFVLIRECNPVLKGNFEVDYVLYVTTHGEYHRIEENEYC